MDIKELVDLCKKGNEQALSLLYKTYSKKMMRICLHYIPDKQVSQCCSERRFFPRNVQNCHLDG